MMSAALLLSTASIAVAADKVDIAFLPGQVGIPFYSSMQCGAEAAAKEFDVNMSWAGPPDWDISLQQPFVDAPQFDCGARDRSVDDLRGEKAQPLCKIDQRRCVCIRESLERQIHGGHKDRATQRIDHHAFC